MGKLAKALDVDAVLIVVVTESTQSSGAFAVRVGNYLTMKMIFFNRDGNRILYVSSSTKNAGGFLGGSPSDINYHSMVLDLYDNLVRRILGKL